MLCSRESLQVPRESLLPLETVTHTTLSVPPRGARLLHMRAVGGVYIAPVKRSPWWFFSRYPRRAGGIWRDMHMAGYGGIPGDTRRYTWI